MKATNFKRFLCTLLTAVMLLTLCPLTVSAATSLKISKTSVTLTKGYYTTLKINTSKKAAWSTSDKSVATVSSSGKVLAKSAGSCYITAKVGSSSVRCKVTVVNGKLAVSQSTVNLDEGESIYLTVTATGSHSVGVVHSDRSIAKAGWVKPWNGNNIRLKITGVSAGKTTIKVRMSKYTEISKTITVNVNAADLEIEENEDTSSSASSTAILTGTTSVNVEKGKTSTFEVYSGNTAKTTVTSSNTNVATVSQPKWSDNGNGTVTVTGVSGGTAVITVANTENANSKKTITVTVTADGYYVVNTTVPYKKLASDSVINWVSDNKTYYMLVPYGYDTAHTNTAFAKETKPQYYLVYDEVPSKIASDDQTASFKHTVEGKSVTRYILLPRNYDAVRSTTASASYTNKFNYYTVYNVTPAKQSVSDVIRTWQASVDGVLYTRSVLLPANYSEDQLKEIMNSDISVNNTYYSVSESAPQKNDAKDTVYQFAYNGKMYNVLLPENFDPAKRDTAIAKFTGNFNYYVIYTEKPEKLISTDTVKDWRKIVDNKSETRYMLVPAGYSEEFYKSLISDDVNSGNIYYVISDSYPSVVQNGDIPYRWYNSKAKKYRYMLLPEKYDVLKRNNTVYADTGVFEYYTAYSTQPVKQSEGDQIISFRDSAYGNVYILVPADYDQSKLDAAMNEVTQ